MILSLYLNSVKKQGGIPVIIISFKKRIYTKAVELFVSASQMASLYSSLLFPQYPAKNEEISHPYYFSPFLTMGSQISNLALSGSALKYSSISGALAYSYPLVGSHCVTICVSNSCTFISGPS